MMSYLQRYFISGLLVWLPIWVTILVINFLLTLLNSILLLLPKEYQPDALLGVHIPFIGVFIILIVIFSTGILAANILGRQFIGVWDAMINRIPLVRTIHAGVKQVLQTLFTPGGQSFRKVFLVEYPRPEMWTIAFQTGDPSEEVAKVLPGEAMVSLFVPTTPNPTSGFLLMVERRKVIELKMSVDQALKIVLSLGVMQPNNQKTK